MLPHIGPYHYSRSRFRADHPAGKNGQFPRVTGSLIDQRPGRMKSHDIENIENGIAGVTRVRAIHQTGKRLMADPTRDSRSSADSARDILDEWNISGESVLSSSTLSRVDADGFCVPSIPGPGQSAIEERNDGASIEFLAGFALDACAADGIVPDEVLATIDHRKTAVPAVMHAGSSGAGGESSPRSRDGVLHPGDEQAGFRIVLELGRGAFARVYLAEEVNLGRRLVAVKVSRPDGDEPRILARLQHAHIVPVHSVCDDPASNQRFLCMPYFGGADLARVLQASGGLMPTRHDGGSLVKALDQVSRKLPDCSATPPTRRTASPLRPMQPSRRSPASQSADSMSHGVTANSRASRVRGLLFRLVGTPAALSAPGDLAVPERDEPSRQFLRGASAIQAAVWIVARLAEGLEHAHSRGLLHRDLKPSNVLLAADGTPMLLDFNLAVENPVGSPEGEIQRALVGGTLPYMSPEHIDAFNPCGTTPADAVDERSDIYALGLIFYEILAGVPPFPDPPSGSPLLEILDLMIASRRRPPSLRALCPQLPWSLDALAAKCLAFDPARRYARAADLAEDLRRFLDDLPMKHCPEPSVRERMGKWARRHPGLCGSTSIAIVAILLLGLLGGAVALVYDRMQELSARVRYRVFDQDFTEIQFLLNTAGGSNEHLKKGIEKAAQTIEPLGGTITAPARWGDWARRLVPEERRRLREQVVELIMLEARARVLLASQGGSKEDRRRSIEKAIDRLDRAEKIDQAAPSALFAERSRYHAALDQNELARRDQKRSQQIVPSTCHDLTLLATSRLSGGDRLGAEEALREALRRDVSSFWAWFVLGHCHYAQGRFIEAAGDFAACAVRGPKFAWVHFNRGLALARAGRPLEARYAYDRAIELDPVLAEALVNRAMVELDLNELAAAHRDLIRSIELGRDDLVTMTSLAETLARMGRRDEAERYFAGLLARDPSSLVVRVARGITRIAADPAGARTDLKLALDEAPRHAHAHYGMALMMRSANPRDALIHLEDALQSDPHLIDAVQLRALVRARLGQPAALDDVEILLQSPTPHHLYNAACAVALYSEKAKEPRFVVRALDLLARAIDAGFSPAEAAGDPDLSSLRQSPNFARILARKQAR
jgi:eukaryotic-like serine/threonine-protein kinase